VHFERIQELPIVKTLLAYEKELNDGFAETGLGNYQIVLTHAVV
jgi:hypothetical protein